MRKGENGNRRRLLPEEEGRLKRALEYGVTFEILMERYPVSLRYLKRLKSGKVRAKQSPGPAKKHPTTCSQGHPFTEENRYYRINSFGAKESYCRPCAIERIRRYRQQQKASR